MKTFERFINSERNPFIKFLGSDRIGSSAEDVASVHEELEGLKDSLAPRPELQKIVERDSERIFEYLGGAPGPIQTGEEMGFVERATIYHSAKSYLDGLNKNKWGAISHKLRRYGYNLLALPAEMAIVSVLMFDLFCVEGLANLVKIVPEYARRRRERSEMYSMISKEAGEFN